MTACYNGHAVQLLTGRLVWSVRDYCVASRWQTDQCECASSQIRNRLLTMSVGLDSTSLIVAVRVCRDLRYLLYYEYQPSFSSSGRRVCSLVYWPVTSRHYHDSWTAAVCRLCTQHWRLPVGQVHIQSVSQLTSLMKVVQARWLSLCGACHRN